MAVGTSSPGAPQPEYMVKEAEPEERWTYPPIALSSRAAALTARRPERTMIVVNNIFVWKKIHFLYLLLYCCDVVYVLTADPIIGKVHYGLWYFRELTETPPVLSLSRMIRSVSTMISRTISVSSPADGISIIRMPRPSDNQLTGIVFIAMAHCSKRKYFMIVLDIRTCINVPEPTNAGTREIFKEIECFVRRFQCIP